MKNKSSGDSPAKQPDRESGLAVRAASAAVRVARSAADPVERKEAATYVFEQFIAGTQKPAAVDDAPFEIYADYIADCLGEILSEVDPLVALNLKMSKSGRRRGKRTHDVKALAAAYSLLVKLGLKPEQAKLRLTSEIGAVPRTIDRAREEWPDFEKPEFEVELVKTAAAPYQTEIDRILAGDRQESKP